MYLIATDEAGYGPKLGPLVVVATAWRLPSPSDDPVELAGMFAGMSEPVPCGDLSVTIDDSKQVFRQGAGLGVLHAVTSAGLHWCGAPWESFPQFLSFVCPDDLPAIAQARWLSACEPIPLLDHGRTHDLIERWKVTGIELVDVKARVIPARQFNEAYGRGFNKSDLLSDSTLGLVRDIISSLPDTAPQVGVHCDRHGGRRFYASPLQHHFPDWMLRVDGESNHQSRYRLCCDGREVDVRFTVKGDRFAPVAFSSLVAKYLRERFMESLNSFFALRHRGPHPLKPTAGYPVDAERFLQDIAAIRMAEAIADVDLVRIR